MCERESKPPAPPVKKHPELEKFGNRVAQAMVEGMNQQFPPKN